MHHLPLLDPCSQLGIVDQVRQRVLAEFVKSVGDEAESMRRWTSLVASQ
ncbi:hypothetical protein FM105_03985 [Brevibacterium yomogidense]|uniref:Uncharacterized protein n=1 Tax=Brevibacterium yomogidense TaxID=946573 RepID=A0A1X6X4Z0_9MICO|nr:hypothetical protein FM105_03985 [Brevibacterium yomogidense]